jgi:hypothetical protein
MLKTGSILERDVGCADREYIIGNGLLLSFRRRKEKAAIAVSLLTRLAVRQNGMNL